MTDKHTHATHPKVISRLKRANGHLRSVIDMIEQGKPCLEIAQQLHAVEKAVINAKRVLIHDHIDHCLDDDAEGHSADMAEFREIARYL
ncbi:metal-sensing transcriptional repressor [Granulosicoccus antarcticus]|uniref:Copper-sensing transcriptional repressor CsoR n=1 Tax=Granulosicoccus antarcticus IMCC3135 TaxID=1192854 RepID=A0A2Z2NQ76_9GAMM|nr:metal-sensing transcriptional repressor [Granulosicoccus antarcticus]ASJ73379.1 Copper-sensing transcriptional repressor CsoR [Granulosicoccus antarcticus IMCC3135]